MKKNNLLRLTTLLLGVWLSIGLSIGQERALTGTVYDAASNEALPGATVVVQGTTTGATTDLDGKFQINVEDGQTVVVSFIGYMNEEIAISGQSSLEISLTPDLTELSEVIVIGYGTQKKIDKTGAVAQVTAEDMNGGVLTDPLTAIAGKASGVVVTKGGGNPNDDVKIKIRGSSGISGSTNTDPLYVIDGVPDADPNMVAPEDIETFNILKDAASTAIYGSRGANGVIIITTKSGKEGRARVQFNSTTSINQISKKLDLLSADSYRTLVSEGYGDFIDGEANTDWQDEIFRTATSQNTNLSLSGGTAKGDYYASITNSSWEGIIKGSSKDRTIANLKVNHKAFNDKVVFSGGVSTTFEKNDLVDYGDGGREDVLYQAYRMNPTDPVKNPDGTIAYLPVTEQRGYNYINPAGIIEDIEKNDTKKKFLGNISADWEIIEGLNAKVSSSYLNKDKEYRYFRPVGIYGGQGEDNGAGSRWYEVDAQKTIETTLNYAKTISGVHNLTVLGGYSWQENTLTKFGVDVRDAQSPSVGIDNLQSLIDVNHGDVQSEARMSRLIGFFGRATYNYDSRYYISGSIRRDGSTKFGADHQWGIFPTAAVGWNIDRESFMDNANAVSQLKLRASYGVSGNQAFDPYFSQTVFKPSSIVVDPVSGNNVLTWATDRNSNKELKWEETTEINAGIDYGFLSNRFSGSIEYYNKTTNDLLNEYSVPSPPEIYSKKWANSATVLNQGWEFFLMAGAISNANFTWNTTVGVSKNEGKVTELGRYWSEVTDGRKGWLSGDGMVGGDNYTIFIEEDQPLGNFYLYEFSHFEDGVPLYKNNTKEDPSEPDFIGEKDLENDDRKIVGNATPDIELSWGNNFTFYENISLDFSLRALVGQQVYNHTDGFFSSPSHLPQRNVTSGAEDFVSKEFTGTFNKPTDLFLEDASFLRLDYISLAYFFSFEETSIVKNLKLSLNANNLFVVTKYSGSDPEMSIDGLDYGVDNFSIYPKTRTFSLSINATF